MFWLIAGVMLAAAVLVVAVPLYREEKRLSATNISAIVVIAAVSAVSPSIQRTTLQGQG